MRVGLIGGTGWTVHAHGATGARPEASYAPSAGDAGVVRVDTPFGAVAVHVTRVAGHPAFLVHRHGTASGRDAHAVPPHRINHKANAWALRACRVDRVLALVSTGALRAHVPTPGLVVPDDFIDASGHPQRSFFDDAPVHVAMDAPYCPVTRRALLAGAADAGLPVVDGGVYAAVAGPRLETPAEVRALARDADVVGMTGCPEAALAREQGLCYAQLALVANRATGVGAGAAADAGAIKAASAGLAKDAARVVDAAVRRLADAGAASGGCACADALTPARL